MNEGGDGDLIFTVRHSGRRREWRGRHRDLRARRGRRARRNVLDEPIGNGPFFESDLDDGFDIDEYNDGSIFASIKLTVATNNLEEGFDFNDNNAGDLDVDMQQVSAIGNGEEGIDLEEDDDFGGGGDLVAVMNNIVTIGNGNAADGGLKIREKEVGSLDVTLTNILSVDNFGSGIFVRESGAGDSAVTIESALVSGSKVSDFGEGEFGGGHGIEILESGAGKIWWERWRIPILRGTSAFGVFGEETGAGTGAVTLIGGDLHGRAERSREIPGGNAIVP